MSRLTPLTLACPVPRMQLYLHEVLVSQHDECVIAVEVLSSSKAGQGHHKVKIAGVMVSEESGEGGIKNYGAIQMVAEVRGLWENAVHECGLGTNTTAADPCLVA